jgi:hypothetical protein
LKSTKIAGKADSFIDSFPGRIQELYMEIMEKDKR